MMSRFVKSFFVLVMMLCVALASEAQGTSGVRGPGKKPVPPVTKSKPVPSVNKPSGSQSAGKPGKKPPTTNTKPNNNKSGGEKPTTNTPSNIYISAGSSALQFNSITNTFTYGEHSYKMVYVADGTFTMGATSKQGEYGSYDEKPAHTVTLRRFYIGQTEVPQWLWKAVMDSNPSDHKGDNLPVERVSWDDCQIFISKLNSLTNKNFALPTEAQWEFAARGGNRSRGYKYSGSDNIEDVAWYEYNSGKKTQNVGTKKPNELGLYDMNGNVCEWCYDYYGPYSSSPQRNPIGANKSDDRVVRGSFYASSSWAGRISYRSCNSPDSRRLYIGFRLAMNP